jgi:hypothetical protein
MGIWSAIRGQRWVKSGLRGVNAAAVGLIYTALYRLWQIGFVDEGFEAGKSLGDDPWWVVCGRDELCWWDVVSCPCADGDCAWCDHGADPVCCCYFVGNKG